MACSGSTFDERLAEKGRRRLNVAFGLHWKRAPAHTAVRYILQGLDPVAVEQVFRRYAARLQEAASAASRRAIALDGKTLRRSFDNFTDRKAAQVLHAFNADAGLVLAHIEIDEKSNEIPAAQRLLSELQVADCIVTLDAIHCQKKLRGRRPGESTAHPRIKMLWGWAVAATCILSVVQNHSGTKP
jgi:hypothetical protein